MEKSMNMNTQTNIRVITDVHHQLIV